jgi:hypothetical protein
MIIYTNGGVMALRGKKPEEIQKRLKAFFYGPPGGGKTTAAIQFPCPYLIDTEKGAEFKQYVKLLSNVGGVRFQTTEFNEVVSEIKSLISENHPYKTLVIDTMTVIYDNLLDAAVEKFSKGGKDGTEHGRHHAEASRHMKRLFQLLGKLDMNVIITAHIKKEYGAGNVVIGTIFDCFGKIDRIFDLVIEIKKFGKNRQGIVKKTRIESFEEGESFDFSYEAVADRYGKEVIEKDAVPQKLASAEQVERIKKFSILSFSIKESLDKALIKANASCYADLTEEQAQKIIDWVERKPAVGRKIEEESQGVKQQKNEPKYGEIQESEDQFIIGGKVA